MMFLEAHKDTTLIVEDVIRIPNYEYDRFAVKTQDGNGDYLWLVSPLRRDRGVLQTVPGMLVPVWAATHRGAVSAVMLAKREVLIEGPGELRALTVQQILRWDDLPTKPDTNVFYGGAA